MIPQVGSVLLLPVGRGGSNKSFPFSPTIRPAAAPSSAASLSSSLPTRSSRPATRAVRAATASFPAVAATAPLTAGLSSAAAMASSPPGTGTAGTGAASTTASGFAQTFSPSAVLSPTRSPYCVSPRKNTSPTTPFDFPLMTLTTSPFTMLSYLQLEITTCGLNCQHPARN
jgi:hypothetical protein